jgi:hypothetical protein
MHRSIPFLIVIIATTGAGCAFTRFTTPDSRTQDAATAQLIAQYQASEQQRVNRFNQEEQQAMAAQLDQLNRLSVDQFKQQLRLSARQISEKLVSDSGKGMILPGSFADTCYGALQSDYSKLDSIVTNLDSIRATYNASTSAIKVDLSKLDAVKTTLQTLAVPPSDQQQLSELISVISMAYSDAQQEKKNITTGKSSAAK